MSDFYSHLMKKIVSSLANSYDFSDINYLFTGSRAGSNKNKALSGALYDSRMVTDRFINKSNFNSATKKLFTQLDDLALDFAGMDDTYQMLCDAESKELLVILFAYKLLGPEKILIPTYNDYYIKGVAKCKELETRYKDKVFPYKQPKAEGFAFQLHFNNLKELGFDLEIYLPWMSVMTSFVMEQYTYKSANKVITVQPGDICIDAGGCWGDTALYFAGKAGPTGKVYSYEFIPSNIDIMNLNLSLNPTLKDRVVLVPHPVFDKSNMEMYYVDDGPSSDISFDKISDNLVKTLSIDDLTVQQKLPKVDFIKMDIEGAELSALQGAEQTIRRFKPDLAIAIYHSNADFVQIPEFLRSLDLGYKFYLGHYTVYGYETIFYATID